MPKIQQGQLYRQAGAVARSMARKFPRFEFDELYNEAVLACLKAERSGRVDEGRESAYYTVVARNALRPWVAQQLSPAALGRMAYAPKQCCFKVAQRNDGGDESMCWRPELALPALRYVSIAVELEDQPSRNTARARHLAAELSTIRKELDA